MSVNFDRGSPGKFDSRTLNRKTLNRWAYSSKTLRRSCVAKLLRSVAHALGLCLHIKFKENVNQLNINQLNISNIRNVKIKYQYGKIQYNKPITKRTLKNEYVCTSRCTSHLSLTAEASAGEGPAAGHAAPPGQGGSYK